MSGVAVVGLDELPFSEIAREFVGEDQGGADVSFLLVQAPPGRGPALHRHDYAEVIIVQACQATFSVGDEEIVAVAGDVVVVPPGVAHGFVNSGDDPLRQIDIHANGRFQTEWL